MDKSSKMSFRVSENLKTYLSDNALGCEMSLTDYCIWILESYKKGEDITGSTDTERDKGNARLKEYSVQFETDRKKMLSDVEALKNENEALKSDISRIKLEFHKQKINNMKDYQESIKKSVESAYQRGLNASQQLAEIKILT